MASTAFYAQNAAGEHWLTGAGFTWGPLFTRMAQQVMDGTWEPTNDIGSLASGYAALAPYGPLVYEETKALVESSKASLISRSLEVFPGPIVTQHDRLARPRRHGSDFLVSGTGSASAGSR